MPPIQAVLRERLAAALQAIGADPALAQLAAASDTQFGDYQTNAAMVLAKQRRINPRQLAGELLAQLDVADLCDTPEVAGPGFINFRLSTACLESRMQSLLHDPRLGVAGCEAPRTIIADFSAPNIAKPMHVGHIRSTILGDTLVRVARFLGHRVITDNHIGDWGTQFGKVIYGWKHLLDRQALHDRPIQELVRLYREANRAASEDPAILEACRNELVRLQQGDPENLGIWRECVALSWGEFERIYSLLDIRFDACLGESFYNDRLAPLVERLLNGGIAELSEGAVCVFFRDQESLADKPCLIRKSDGGFLYATTDLATLEYRMEHWKPDAVWYVTGAPQALHFKQVFEVARRMGITCELHHIPFGSILGEDRKLMKTRSGDNVQLDALLEEALERASSLLKEKNPILDAAESSEIARIIGIGAVKYAELSQHRLTDYVFSWDKMLSFQGNTAPYLQNAYVRIQSIFRRLTAEEPEGTVTLQEQAEKDLARKLIHYSEAVPAVLDDFRPNLLANYLYELANAFHAFYEACPVLKSVATARATRLALCRITADVLRHGLDLLGIRVPERM